MKVEAIICLFLAALLVVQSAHIHDNSEQRRASEDTDNNLTELLHRRIIRSRMDDTLITDQNVLDQTIQKLTDANYFRIRSVRNNGVSKRSAKHHARHSHRHRHHTHPCSRTGGSHGCAGGWLKLKHS